MSRRHKSKVRVAVKPVPIPRALVRAQLAGEMIKACDGSDDAVLIAQKGVSNGWIAEVIVYGTDENDCIRDQVSLNFDGDQSGEIELDLDGGKRAAIEALDGSLARAVQFQAQRMRKRGLRPSVRFRLSDAIYADAARLVEVRGQLGTEDAPPAQWRSGYRGERVLSIRPGKDRGMTLSLLHEFFGGTDE